MIGLSSLSMAQTPRFTKVNGVVTDSKTTLEWQDDYSDNGGNVKNATWTDAIDYCEALSLNAKDDWRLPNKKELLSIVNYGTYAPALNSAFNFLRFYFHYYWSSTTHAANTNVAWAVDSEYGNTYESYKSSNLSVRCVRAGQ